jgi:hypothetical protein
MSQESGESVALVAATQPTAVVVAVAVVPISALPEHLLEAATAMLVSVLAAQ